MEFTGGEDLEFDPESDFLELFFSWMHHWWLPDPHSEVDYPSELHDVEPSAVWLDRHGRNVPHLLRQYLEGCLRMHFSFHEVESVEPGTAMTVMDLLTGEHHEVLEAAATQGMTPGLILFGALVETAGVTLIEGVGSAALTQRDKPIIIELREDFRRRGRSTGADLREFTDELIGFYLDLVGFGGTPALPEVRNTDGEELVPQTLHFDIDDAEAAWKALAHLDFEFTEDDAEDSVERDADGRIVQAFIDWKRPGNAQNPDWDNTVVGRIDIRSGHLEAKVNSDERAARLQQIIAEALGGAARFRLSSRIPREDYMDALMTQAVRHVDGLPEQGEA